MPGYETKDWEELGDCTIKVKTVKPIHAETVLGLGGACRVRIVCPDQPVYYNMAYRIQAYLSERGGVSVPVVNPHQIDIQKNTDHLIALGNLNTNALLAELYHSYYVAADAAYPGVGGYVVRTVCDPWGKNCDVLVLGGSDVAGVERATDRLLDVIQIEINRIWVDRLIEVGIGEPFKELCKEIDLACTTEYRERMIQDTYRRLEQGEHRGATPNVAHVGMMYHLTGDERFAQLYLELFKIMYQNAVNDTGEGPWSPWGFDADFQSVSMVQAWDLVEDASVFSDQDRLYITNHLIAYLQNNVKHAIDHRPDNAKSCRHNHYTFACLGLLFGSRYFQKYYDYPDARTWMEPADECFVPQAEAFKANEDCNSYQWATFSHMLRYAFVRPDPTFIENGKARLCLDMGIATMDNLGHQASYGDCETYADSNEALSFYKAAAWALKDPMYSGVLARKQALQPHYIIGGPDPIGYEYDIDLGEGRPLHQFFGGAAVPLDPRYYYTFEGEKHIPQEQAFDKIVFRENFNPRSDYLLLDGLSNGGHGHYDGNAIVRLTSAGRIWLADADYMKSPPQFHNTVLISRNGESHLIPPYAELERVSNLGSVAYSGSTISDYVGTNWTRHILWDKERYFLVVDQVVAKQEGDYDLRCLWRGVGDVELDVENRRMTIVQGEERFHIQAAPGYAAPVHLKLIHEPMIWASWDEYLFHGKTSDVKVLRERQTVHLEEASEVFFFNLLGTEGKLPPLSISRVNEGLVALMKRMGGNILFGVKTGFDALDGIATDAVCAQLSTDRLTLIHATYLSIGDGKVFESSDVLDLAIDLAANRLTVKADGPTTLTFPCGLSVESAKGGNTSEIACASGIQSIPLSGRAEALKDVVRYFIDTVTSTPSDFAKQIPFPPAGYLTKRLDTFEWSGHLPDGSTPRSVAAADLDGDGSDELVIGTEEGVVFSLRQGGILWRHEAKGRINSLACDDIDGDGRPEVIVGSADHHVYLLNADGVEQWRFEVPYYMHESVVKTVFGADLGLDRGRAVIAGANSCHFHAIAPDGRELWRYEAIHGASHGCAVDINRDGVDEIFAVTEWWPWHCISAQGKGLWPLWSARPRISPGANMVTAGDVAGDGDIEMVCGAVDSCVYVFDRNGRMKWQYYTGEEVTDLVCADVDGDGRAEIFAGSHNGYLYRIDGEGKQVWNRFLGDAIRSLLCGIFRGGQEVEILAATRSPYLYHIDLAGDVQRVLDVGEPIHKIETVSLPGGPGVGIVTVTGRVSVWNFK